MDEAELNEAAIERTPGGVGWDDDMGRFGALVKMLRLGGMVSLAGLPLPDPKKDGFDAAVKKMFYAASEQRASQSLVPAQGTETADDEPEARDGEADAGSPSQQLQQQPPALPSGRGKAPATAAGSATDAPQPPAPAPTEAPPLMVPPSALRGLDLDGLVSQLRDVLAAAPLDEAMVRHVLDGLEGLGLSGQALEDAGAPPTAHMPGVPAHLHRAHPPAQLSTLTLSRPRTGACKLVNRIWGERGDKRGVSTPLKARANELYDQWTSDGNSEL